MEIIKDAYFGKQIEKITVPTEDKKKFRAAQRVANEFCGSYLGNGTFSFDINPRERWAQKALDKFLVIFK